MSDTYLILAIQDNDYQELQSSRQSTISRQADLSLEIGAAVLVYLKSSTKLVAEYDIEKVSANGTHDTLHLEPIYISPEGFVLTDLVLLTLPEKSLETWRSNLETEIFSISENEYRELVQRLKG